MSKAPKISEVVVDFLLGEIDPGFLQAYEFLALLDYPILDHKSFTEQVRPQTGKGDDEGDTPKFGAHKLVTTFFGPHDFPIMTVEGALERFHAYLLDLTDFIAEESIPRSKSRAVGPAPGEKEDICDQRREDFRKECINDGVFSADFCNTLAWQEYLECLQSWRNYSLPFSRKGLRRESFIGRPPRTPPFTD